MYQTIIINFSGGIISPGNLYNILVAATKARIQYVRFGLRQQLLIDTTTYNIDIFTGELDKLRIDYEIDSNNFPNIISSYPAEEIFIRKTWLTEGVYKDILDDIDFKPSVKVNICDSDQSFTPMLTGNINWIASSHSEHYWHLIIRFPKTNVTYEWNQLCYTNHIAQVTKSLETIIKNNPTRFIDNTLANGEELFALLDQDNFILKAAENTVSLSSFNLPYYEGLNRYNNKYWLGIYRRDELFSIAFLKKLCQLCLDTKLGQLCCTSWKTIIVKGIDEKDKKLWNALLEEYEINMRHAANELNFQVEDNCNEGLALKSLLVKHLSIDDTRTFGICFGIKTRKKSEVFSSILIQKRHLINLLGMKLFPVYDILCAKDFNPNERTGEIFSRSNPGFLLPEQLRRAIFKFYKYRLNAIKTGKQKQSSQVEETAIKVGTFLYQCNNCLTVYNERIGEIENNINPGTAFKDLPDDYCCALCEGEKSNFTKIDQSVLQLL
ncbi:rubredoxin [Pedobacter alluvionis]|uniref:Rubredoxin n=1 Tax=Pedobacter alluvionis TaxID=475253 RepID=A0A497Y006_9SPHI|nr:rubredoxin [Pedobacter alluvionis]RLJ75039.1 rubredoxin [Pedobacter alluvionis]TFB30149.1 rubredoxin [Pedobacter alluvionis]